MPAFMQRRSTSRGQTNTDRLGRRQYVHPENSERAQLSKGTCSLLIYNEFQLPLETVPLLMQHDIFSCLCGNIWKNLIIHLEDVDEAMTFKLEIRK